MCYLHYQLSWVKFESCFRHKVRVWARPEYAGELTYINNIAGEILEFYESWTGIRYPFSKLGQFRCCVRLQRPF